MTWTDWNAVPCSYCGAPKDAPCKTNTGNPAREVHSDRVRKAEVLLSK